MLPLTATNELPLLHPPHGPILPSFWERYGVWFYVAMALAVLVGVLVRLLTKPTLPILEPAEAQARRKLEALCFRSEEAALWGEVSGILKGYLGMRLGLVARERTTAEFCELLFQKRDINALLVTEITDFLRACDRQRFAAGTAEPLNAVARALEFIERMEKEKDRIPAP